MNKERTMAIKLIKNSIGAKRDEWVGYLSMIDHLLELPEKVKAELNINAS